MTREHIPFTTEKAWLDNRVHDLTSSDIPCLFGVGYQTYDDLLQCKLNKIQKTIEPNERMDWGASLQDSIALYFARKNNWIIHKKTEYIRIPELKLGSSFDFEIFPGIEESANALLEIKNVDSLEYKNKWIQGFEIQATPYIELQVQHQLLVSGLITAYIGVLIGGNKGLVLKREANPRVQLAIMNSAAEFWRKINEAK